MKTFDHGRLAEVLHLSATAHSNQAIIISRVFKTTRDSLRPEQAMLLMLDKVLEAKLQLLSQDRYLLIEHIYNNLHSHASFGNVCKQCLDSLEKPETVVDTFLVSVFDDNYVSWTGYGKWYNFETANELVALPVPHVTMLAIDCAALFMRVLKEYETNAQPASKPTEGTRNSPG